MLNSVHKDKAVESVQAKEERLREKLKRKAEELKKEETNSSTITTEQQEDKRISQSKAKPNSNSKKSKSIKSKSKSKPESKSSPSSSSTKNHSHNQQRNTNNSNNNSRRRPPQPTNKINNKNNIMENRNNFGLHPSQGHLGYRGGRGGGGGGADRYGRGGNTNGVDWRRDGHGHGPYEYDYPPPQQGHYHYHQQGYADYAAADHYRRNGGYGGGGGWGGGGYEYDRPFDGYWREGPGGAPGGPYYDRRDSHSPRGSSGGGGGSGPTNATNKRNMNEGVRGGKKDKDRGRSSRTPTSRSRSRSHSDSYSRSTYDGSRSRSGSRSTSASASASASFRSRSSSASSTSSIRNRSLSSDRSQSRSRSVSHSRSRSPIDKDKKRSRSHDSHDEEGSKKSRVANNDINNNNEKLTKDQRTIFVSQLVMKTEERDVRKFFRKTLGCKVNDVQLLRDRRTGRHKGCAYVELGRLEDVPTAVAASGTTPGFQRFPILVKASEAEKNYGIDGGISAAQIQLPSSSLSPTAATAVIATAAAPINNSGVNKRIEAQKVYIGSIDRNVTQAQLYAIFSQFGDLEKVTLQVDIATGISKGFAFMSFKDPKVANLAIQCMSGQVLAGRPL